MRFTTLPLFLLCCVRFLLGDDAATNKYVIVCGNLEPTTSWLARETVVMFWDTEANTFVRTMYPSVKINDCSLDTVGKICRKLFKDVSYPVELNETFTFVQTVPWYRRAEPEHTVNHDLKKFKCQDYIRAEELVVPEGNWSDRLTTVAHSTSTDHGCTSEEDLLNFARDECGKEPTNHTFGAQCGEEKKYLEIMFVCDAPKNETIFQFDDEFFAHKDKYHHESQFALLERYATISEELQGAIVRNDTGVVSELSKKLQRVLSSAAKVIRTARTMSEGSTIADIDGLHGYVGFYLSRERSLSCLESELRWAATVRSNELFRIAALLMSNDTAADQTMKSGNFQKFDATELLTKFDFGRDVKTELDRFPELKPRLIKYYVDFIKNHTLGISREHLGFLNETGAHERLLMMYTEIFSPLLINKKYLEEPGSDWMMGIIVVVIFAIVAGLLYPLQKNKKANRVGDFAVHFNKHGVVENFENPNCQL